MAGLIERIEMMQLVQPDDMMTAMNMIVTPWVGDGPWLMAETWLLIAAWRCYCCLRGGGERL